MNKYLKWSLVGAGVVGVWYVFIRQKSFNPVNAGKFAPGMVLPMQGILSGILPSGWHSTVKQTTPASSPTSPLSLAGGGTVSFLIPNPGSKMWRVV
jgi:uncharacterized protein YjeT (DUF2065 family)